MSKIKGEILPDYIGYLVVPETRSVSEKYPEKLQSTIKEVDQGNPEKWIIDLRGNQGGNMWQMLLGLAPLLDEGVQGYFGDDAPDMATWLHNSGEVKCKSIEDEFLLELENSYNLKAKPTQVAVLIDSKTASSGEAIAVAFKGRKGTRFFGEKTFGASSGNCKHKLQDGALIFLTECYFFDRNKNKYTEGVFPDEEIVEGCPQHDECLEKAIFWLK